MKQPAEAARAPRGATKTITGTRAFISAFTILRIAESSPPGVSSCRMRADARRDSTSVMPREMYSALMALIGPAYVKTTTSPARAGEDSARQKKIPRSPARIAMCFIGVKYRDNITANQRDKRRADSRRELSELMVRPRFFLELSYTQLQMNTFRIALANIRFPATPDESVTLAERAIAQASNERAVIVCFPECFVPGYRVGKSVPPADPAFLDRAWSTIAAAAARAGITVVLGTERIVREALFITALVINPDGKFAGFQDKVQLDPSEDAVYSPGSERRIFQTGSLTFGVVICHEGWRYPETVRWAVRHGAQIVFHPHFGEAEPGSYQALSFAHPANSFHEKAALCRAAENTCYFATVNCASAGSPTTSAVVRPDGTLLVYQPYGKEGLLIADIDIAAATGLLASRYKSV